MTNSGDHFYSTTLINTPFEFLRSGIFDNKVLPNTKGNYGTINKHSSKMGISRWQTP